MECDEMLPDLVRAYEKEQTLFVRPDFLKAIRSYEFAPYLPVLKERKAQIENMEENAEEIKHLREEAALLQNMIFMYEKPKKHTFTAVSYTHLLEEW